MVDDDAARAKAVEQVKREMDLLAQIGGKRMAAPPAGANGNNAPVLDLVKAAERYRAILDLGDKMGITPILELWGSSKNLHRLGECMFVVIESGHPKAGLLGDVFHIYKGGSDFSGLKKIGATAMPVLHMNDYPADPPRDKIADRDRVMPGDGIAPLTQILHDLARQERPDGPVARIVQPGVLGEGPVGGGQDRAGQDEGGRPRRPLRWRNAVFRKSHGDSA